MDVQILDEDGIGTAHYRKQVFLAADQHPLTYRKMMDLCNESGVYKGEVTFTGDGDGGGKEVNNSSSRQRLAWTPQFESFESFLYEHRGEDFYSSS